MAEWITAIAALVAAFATVGYFIATIYIFRETKKSADAAEKSAAAAEKSAEAANNSITLMRRQFDQQLGLGNFRVETTVDTAIAAIEAILQPQALRNINVPPNVTVLNTLLEEQAPAALSHAALMNQDVAKQLDSAFQLLRTATSDLQELLRSLYAPGHSAYALRAARAQESLERALAKLRDSKRVFTRTPTSAI
ncbi:MAG: hypothetical protein WB607_14855 [Candidatus Acidiferrum sp.]|jgi:hypothetical protein